MADKFTSAWLIKKNEETPSTLTLHVVVENGHKGVKLFLKEHFISDLLTFKVHILWEGHNILRNLHLGFVLCSASQK